MQARCIFLPLVVASLLLSNDISADDEQSALEEMARKAQNPLADVKAIMTDNTIAYGGGNDDDTSYGFQLQPVYSISNESSYNQIARAIIPIMGVEPGVVVPPLGPEPRPGEDSTWGLGDMIVQYFFSPKEGGAWKLGVGPQISLKTHTSDRLSGSGWGAGLAGVAFSGAGSWSYGAIAMQHWGEDDFSAFTLQPIVMYNFPNKPGMYLGYNNSVTYNWEADSGDEWNVPLGLTFGQTLLLGNGDGLDLSIGAYDLVEKPEGGSDWQLKFGISYFFN